MTFIYKMFSHVEGNHKSSRNQSGSLYLIVFWRIYTPMQNPSNQRQTMTLTMPFDLSTFLARYDRTSLLSSSVNSVNKLTTQASDVKLIMKTFLLPSMLMSISKFGLFVDLRAFLRAQKISMRISLVNSKYHGFRICCLAINLL